MEHFVTDLYLSALTHYILANKCILFFQSNAGTVAQ